MLFRQLLVLSAAVQQTAVALRLRSANGASNAPAARQPSCFGFLNCMPAFAQDRFTSVDIHLATLAGKQFSVPMSLRATRRDLEQAVHQLDNLSADERVSLVLEKCEPFQTLRECGFPRAEPVFVVRSELSAEEKAERRRIEEEAQRQRYITFENEAELLMAQHNNCTGLWGGC